MPVYSMTGFASAQMAAPSAPPSRPTPSVMVEVRSVNNRFLDLSFKLPDDLRSHESRWRQSVAARLRRGKVELRIGRPVDASQRAGVTLPSATDLARLAAAQDAVLAAVPGAQPLAVADVLRWTAEPAASAWPSAAELDALLDQALTALQTARATEGERLAGALRHCVATLRALAQQAQPLVDDSVALQRERFLSRWQEAMALVDGSAGMGAVSPQVAQERAVAEVAAFAIKVDVAEELARLHSHLDEVDALLSKGGELGKRLDFLIQELHREVNTLGAKSASLPLTRLSIEMKVQVEQMREQVQNIE